MCISESSYCWNENVIVARASPLPSFIFIAGKKKKKKSFLVFHENKNQIHTHIHMAKLWCVRHTHTHIHPMYATLILFLVFLFLLFWFVSIFLLSFRVLVFPFIHSPFGWMMILREFIFGNVSILKCWESFRIFFLFSFSFNAGEFFVLLILFYLMLIM